MPTHRPGDNRRSRLSCAAPAAATRSHGEGVDVARRDRGSVTVWLALASLVMIIVVGLAVDLTGQVHTQQYARDVAAQAARAGGEQINTSAGIRGLGAQASPAQAVAAAQAYLRAAGVTGTVAITGGTTLTVTTSATYQTRFLSIIGLSSMPVTGSAQARIVRAVGGAEQ